MESKKRSHFPDAFKREAVDRARTSRLTIIQVDVTPCLSSRRCWNPDRSEGLDMKQSRFNEEQIIGILRENEAGVTVGDLCRKYGMSSATFYA